MNNKWLILVTGIWVTLFASSCKDDDKAASPYCLGMYEFIEGDCRCPDNTVDMGVYFCQELSENEFWIQSGDPCLGQAYFWFGKTGQDIFDQNQTTIEVGWPNGPTGAKGSGTEKIQKKMDHYYIYSPYNDINYSYGDFKECVGEEYEFYDLELKIDLDWTTAHVTYKFWNDVDTSIHVKKEFGKELKAVFKSNTAPQKR